MFAITTNYARQILGSLAVISVTICLGSQANGQSTTADLEKMIKQTAGVNNTPAKAKAKPAKVNGTSAKTKPAKAKRAPTRRAPTKAAPAATKPSKLKVPKFGTQALPTFAAPTETIEYSEAVKVKALSTLERYDRDGNRFLDEEELARGSWRPSPLTNDKNGDGRLSLVELQDRYHQRDIERQKYREAVGERSNRGGGGDRASGGRQAYNSSRRGDSSNGQAKSKRDKSSRTSDSKYEEYVESYIEARDQDGNGVLEGDELDNRSRSKYDTNGDGRIKRREMLEVFSEDSGGRQSSSPTSRSNRSRPSSRGLSTRSIGRASGGSRAIVKIPSAFKKLDVNEDRLVQMHEFSKTWPKKKFDEFKRKDTNGDGVIAPEEWK